MPPRSTLSTFVRRLFWTAAAGLAAGIAVRYGLGQTGLWVGLGAAVGAAFAGVIPNRSTPSTEAGPATEHDPLSAALTPLARSLFEDLPDPLMLLDLSGRVLFANRPMRLIVGAGVERKHVSAVLRTPSVLEAIGQTVASGEPASVAFSFPVPVERHYQAYAARVGQNPAVVTLLLHDLTSVKRSEQMRVDFVANASHELRTPLAALSGFIDTLKGHARDDPDARSRFLDIMTVEATRMRRLIDDLLSLTRIELNEHVPPASEVSLDSVVRQAVAALLPLANADKIAIDVATHGELPPVMGDRDELIQLFQNLIHNAIKYGRAGGHVWITLTSALGGTRGAEAMIVASVRDDGEGIPSDAIPRLTERFYRVDVKRSREKGGTGLGLAIVKHILNRHQGRLVIESEAGKGSTFTITFPTSRAPLIASPPTLTAAK